MHGSSLRGWRRHVQLRVRAQLPANYVQQTNIPAYFSNAPHLSMRHAPSSVLMTYAVPGGVSVQSGTDV
jgi:hypothetical protein